MILGVTWVKVFNHNTIGGMFSRYDRDEVRNFNSDDPDADLYSILDQIENYRIDGLFHIRFCYPEYTEEFPCNEWTQSSNFLEETEVADYKQIRITYEKCYGDLDFAGLRKSTSNYWSFFVATCYSWYFGIGYGYGSTSRSYEGAYGKPWISHSELYLLAGMIIMH